MGGLGTAMIALAFPNLPHAVGIPLALLGGMLFGAVFVAIPVVLRLTKGINELLTTLILNYVAVLIVNAVIIGPLASSTSFSYPHTDDFSASYSLTSWPGLGFLHSGIFIAIVVVVFAIYFFWKTPGGFRFRVAGLSPMAGRTAGISPEALKCWADIPAYAVDLRPIWDGIPWLWQCWRPMIRRKLYHRHCFSEHCMRESTACRERLGCPAHCFS